MASDRQLGWAGKGKTHRRSALASLNEEAALICLQAWLYQDPAVLSLPFRSAFLGVWSPVGPCQVVAPRELQAFMLLAYSPMDSACFWFLLRVSRLTLIGSDWVRCPSLNQLLAQGKQESDWPGPDHMITPGVWGGKMVAKK